MKDDTKVTITGGGQTTETTLGALQRAVENGKIKNVESLLELHNDEQTTREINKAWAQLRSTVDHRASLEEKKVKGKLTLTIDYEADSDTGKKDITIAHKLDLPAPPKNTRTLYEDADGNLQTKKPTKQTEMFPDNVKPIRKGV